MDEPLADADLVAGLHERQRAAVGGTLARIGTRRGSRSNLSMPTGMPPRREITRTHFGEMGPDALPSPENWPATALF